TAGVQPVARDEALPRNSQHLAREIEQTATSGHRCIERKFRHRISKRFALFHRPVLDQRPGSIERRVVVKETDPERRQGTYPVPWAAIGTAHLQEALQPDFGKSRREVIDPVARRREFARKRRQLAFKKIAKTLPGGVDVPAVTEHE